jgi:lyso-ornithine lipid O-acyltransferase
MLRVALVTVAVAAITLTLIPLQWLSLRLRLPARRAIPVAYHRMICALLGVRIRVAGARFRLHPLLIVANHVSWLDISVITALAPVVFVAKREVNSWPLFGLLARLQRSVFVDRERRLATVDANVEIAARLAEGDPVVLFAEGTSSDGNRVLPFRSSLVGAAHAALAELTSPRKQGEVGSRSDPGEGACTNESFSAKPPHPVRTCGPCHPLSRSRMFPTSASELEGRTRADPSSAASGERESTVWIQPLSLAYVGLDGLPLGRTHRPCVAWYGELDLLPHLIEIMRRGAIDVVATWGEPIACAAATDRKAVTRALEARVRRMTVSALRARFSS